MYLSINDFIEFDGKTPLVEFKRYIMGIYEAWIEDYDNRQVKHSYVHIQQR